MILVTGASGFIGRALCSKLASEHLFVRGAGRNQVGPAELSDYVSCDLERDAELDELCEGVHTVIHLAGRAHVLNDTSADPAAAFHSANVEATIRLAQAAIRQGVSRFIFLSSIGVNAAETGEGIAVSESSPCTPTQLYGVSKLTAERELEQLIQGTSMALVVIRPPLVYASDAPGNFHRLLKIIGKGLPLPFARVRNQRSMVSRENLVDFIHVCVEHSLAANQTFVISDGVDVSTPEIVRYLASGMGKPPRLFGFPVWMLGAGLIVLGRKSMYSQLCKSLVIDSSKARQLLGWTPPAAPEDALRAAGQHFGVQDHDELGAKTP
ncbi:NAD-dependent epimerase/dehydratase family protein [Pseudomonas putida]|uniref:NAD-dependent epimerase/dehydratase family protein n=1 Tax=Pseudomonas putida TaxID=303 RepID=A0A4D6X5L1_PSEPU|nr:NAD-dependent epimerase/dehydratase family protein [Pseudomonas putida]QCI11304.1 NAD-dependent epimerase/dehydratase family protein [Pseudomonas putida]